MSEHSLWKWLSGGLILPEGHYTRIESPSSAGFPDVHYTINEITGTMELKFARHPDTSHPLKREGFRKSQIDWISDEFIAGGFTALVTQINHHIFWHHPKYIKQINGWSREEIIDHAHIILDMRDPTATGLTNIKRFLMRRL